MSRFLTNDESRSINPADTELGTIREHDGPDECCPFDGRPFTEDGECPKCGYRDAIRAERDKLAEELADFREQRAIERRLHEIEISLIERAGTAELWRWRFTWFWEALVTCLRLDLATDTLKSAHKNVSRNGDHARADIETVENILTEEV
jgi:Rad3-related DNA helicase